MKKMFEGTLTRRILSLALSMAMVLTVLPAGALAEEVESTPATCNCEVLCAETVNESCPVCNTEMGQCTPTQQQKPAQEPEAVTCTHGNDPEGCEACASAKKVAQVQAQIDALPENVTAETKEAAQSALSAVDEAKSALTESEQAQLDMTRYTALAEKLAALESPAPSATEKTTEKTAKVITAWEWDDGFEIVDEESGYLILPFTAEAFTANFEQVKEMLPGAILVDGETLTLNAWTYEAGEEGAAVTIDSESFLSAGVFKTTLPEGFLLEDGTDVLSLTVVLDAPAGDEDTPAAYATNVQYRVYDSASKTWNNNAICASATEVTSSDSDVTWNAGWYVAQGTVNISGRVTVKGDVHLILADNCILTTKNILVRKDDNASLTIYAQSEPTVDEAGNVTGNTGKLTADGTGIDYASGIGGSGLTSIVSHAGPITIHGGVINAIASDGAGIGGGNRGTGGSDDAGFGGIITINGGTVKATSGYGAGIGCGFESSGADITINGGTIEATSGSGAGIGAGSSVSSNGETKITITGGTVTATSDVGAGIGAGSDCKGTNFTANITITGGTVTAHTDADSKTTGCIGGSGNSAGSTTITGGTVITTVSEVNQTHGIYSADFSTGENGSALIILHKSIFGKDDTTGWRGIIFEGNSGTVYGDQTLNKNLTIDAGKNLTIPEGVKLTVPDGVTLTNNGTIEINGTLTNNGTIINNGTITGTPGGRGSYYSALTVTNCSAEGIQTIDGVTYAKSGSTVTLTTATPEVGYFVRWSTTPALTVTNGSQPNTYTFTMPYQAASLSAEFTQSVKITQQPVNKEIFYGENVTLSVGAKNPSGNTDGITYQWYQVINNTEEKLSGETRNSLTLNKPNAGTYVYFCRVTWDGISIDSSRATVTVKKAQASVTINSDPRKPYDGTPVATPSYTVIGDGTPQIEYKLKDADNSTYTKTPPTDAGEYTIRVTIPDSENYITGYATKNFTISKAYNTWTKKPSVKTPAYYGDTVLVTYEARYGNESVSVNYVDKNDNTVAPVNAGEYKVIVSLPENSVNYTGISMDVKHLTILPRPITDKDVIVTLGSDFVYDAGVKTQTVTIQYKGKTLVEGKDYELTGDISGMDADTYTLTITGKGNFSETTSKTWNITKASITPVVSLDDTVYGEALIPSVTGNPGNGAVTYTYYSDANCTTEVTPKNVGTYYVKAAVAETTNYQQATTDAKSFQITKAPLTVKANNKTITYGDAPANDGVTYDGFVNGETESVLGGTLDYTYTYSQYGNVGTGEFKITPSGLTSGNYNITFADGKLTVNQKEIGIDWSNTSLAYNKTEQAPTATATDLVNNDKCAITVTGQQTDVGNYTATASSLSNGNYKLPKEVTQTFEIYAVAPIAALEDAKSVYTSIEELLLSVQIDGGTVYYSLDKTDWSTEIPKAIQCGAYTVYYYIVGDSNHTDIGSQEAPESITANILPFKVNALTVSDPEAPYGTEISLTFDVSTKLEGEITYQWFEVTQDQNGTKVYTPLKGETGNAMTLIPNAGQHTYVCTATCDGYSQDSEPVTVTVNTGFLENVDLNIPNEPGESEGTEGTTMSGYWLEGGEEPAGTDQGSIVQKSPSSRFLTRYFKVEDTVEKKGYPTGMEVYELSQEEGSDTLTPKWVEAFTNLLKYEGCSIRITGKPGIRMITSIDEKLKKELIQDGYGGFKLVSYGTVAQWKDKLEGNSLTLSTGNPGYAYDADSGKDPIFGRSDGRVQYTNVLVWDELDDKQYNEDIVMRPFIKLRKGTQELVIYGGTVSRSIGYVAQQNADTFPKGSAGYNYVHDIIDRVEKYKQNSGSTTTPGGNGE